MACIHSLYGVQAAIPTTAVPTKSEQWRQNEIQFAGGRVSSKPKGLTRCEVLGSGGKPLPWHQLGDRAAL